LNHTTVSTALHTARQQLTAAGCDTPKLDAEVLLAHALGQERTWLYIYPTAPLLPAAVELYAAYVTRRVQREPVAYIVGHQEFFGLDFRVSPRVLIPRPETELLIETALTLAPPIRPLTVVDVGTGSGCIAITLARHLPDAHFTAIDISPAALDVARQNAIRHDVSQRIDFLPGHLLAPVTTPVDVIVSNPPYVSRPYLHAESTMPEVRHYEPRLALDGGPAGLDLIETLLAQAASRLNPGGCLLVEIGFDQGQAVTQLARSQFSPAEIELKTDLAGLDRLLVVRHAP
jgi:release factor glutamine methyltransferase